MDERLIAQLDAMMTRHGMASLDIEEGPFSISLRKGGRTAPAAPIATRKIGSLAIHATAIGHFRLGNGSGIDLDAFPRKVRKGEIVGFLDAGGLFRPVIAPDAGMIGLPIVREGDLIGYGDRLF